MKKLIMFFMLNCFVVSCFASELGKRKRTSSESLFVQGSDESDDDLSDTNQEIDYDYFDWDNGSERNSQFSQESFISHRTDAEILNDVDLCQALLSLELQSYTLSVNNDLRNDQMEIDGASDQEIYDFNVDDLQTLLLEELAEQESAKK